MNSISDLSKKNCISCNGQVSPLKGEPLAQLHRQVNKGWKVIDDHHLERVCIQELSRSS